MQSSRTRFTAPLTQVFLGKPIGGRRRPARRLVTKSLMVSPSVRSPTAQPRQLIPRAAAVVTHLAPPRVNAQEQRINKILASMWAGADPQIVNPDDKRILRNWVALNNQLNVTNYAKKTIRNADPRVGWFGMKKHAPTPTENQMRRVQEALMKAVPHRDILFLLGTVPFKINAQNPYRKMVEAELHKRRNPIHVKPQRRQRVKTGS